jgi:hypothetical protein
MHTVLLSWRASCHKQNFTKCRNIRDSYHPFGLCDCQSAPLESSISQTSKLRDPTAYCHCEEVPNVSVKFFLLGTDTDVSYTAETYTKEGIAPMRIDSSWGYFPVSHHLNYLSGRCPQVNHCDDAIVRYMVGNSEAPTTIQALEIMPVR